VGITRDNVAAWQAPIISNDLTDLGNRIWSVLRCWLSGSRRVQSRPRLAATGRF